MTGAVSVDGHLLLAVALLVAGVVAASAWSRTGTVREATVAALRAIVQLAAVGAIIVVALNFWWSTILVLAGMAAVAALTAARRVTGSARATPVFAAILLASVLPPAAVILGSGTFPVRPVSTLAVVAILFGNGLTALGLAGRSMLRELVERRGEVEAALSLGFALPQARGLIVREVQAVSVLPAIDSTKTVGLVTLPGAFTGMLLAGADPLSAAGGQVLVMLAILVVQYTAARLMLSAVSRGTVAAAA